MAYAKLFDNPEHGQLLVVMSTNSDDIPEVRFYTQPEDLGVCSVAISFTDDDEGWALAEAAFEKADEAFALKQVQPIFSLMRLNS